MCPRVIIVFELFIRLNHEIITPGPGTFKTYKSFSFYPILIDFLDFIIGLSYAPGPGTLFMSYLSFWAFPSNPYDGAVYATFL